MTIQVLNPTSEAILLRGTLALRLDSLAGMAVDVISSGKEGTKGFFGHIDHFLRTRYGVADVVMRQKSNFSAPAESELIQESAMKDVAVIGLGD